MLLLWSLWGVPSHALTTYAATCPVRTALTEYVLVGYHCLSSSNARLCTYTLIDCLLHV